MARIETGHSATESSRFRNPKRWREVVERVFPGSLGGLNTSKGTILPIPLRASFEEPTIPTKQSSDVARFRQTFKNWEKLLEFIGLPVENRKKFFRGMMPQIVDFGIIPEYSKNGGLPGVVAIRIISYPDYRFDYDVRSPLSNLGFEMRYADRFGMVQEDGVSRSVVEARFSWSR